MNIKKVPCLAMVIDSIFQENVGRVVSVESRAQDVLGWPMWHCHVEPGLTCCPLVPYVGWQTHIRYAKEDCIIADSCLKQINDPDLPIEEETDETIHSECEDYTPQGV